MRHLIGLVVSFSLVATGSVRIIETAPAGSELDHPAVPNAIEFMPDLLLAADSTIDVAQMYMLYYGASSRGRLLFRLYNALAEAAQRGVRIRVLLDATVAESNPGRTYHRVPAMLRELEGAEVRFCDLRPYSDYPGCMMHAKYLVIDGRISVLGSHNWSYGAMADNRELSVVVEDQVVAGDLVKVFEQDWAVARGEDVRPAVKGPGTRDHSLECRLAVVSPTQLRHPTMPSVLETLRRLVSEAESTLAIEVNSFSTRVDFGEASRFGAVESLLLGAVERGVEVRLLVDRWAFEHEPQLFLALDDRPGLSVRVADIRRAGPSPSTGTLHSKLAIADSRVALLGTATLSQRQLLECRNVAVRLGNRQAIEDLNEVFELDWASRYVSPVQEFGPRR